MALLEPLKDHPTASLRAAWGLAEAYARTGNPDAARQSMQKVFQLFPPANVMWMKPFNDFYKDPAVFETFAAAMQAAGMPLWPFGFDQTHTAERLDAAALSDLYTPGFRAVDATDELGGPWEATARPDGTFQFRTSFLASTYRGTWRIADDRICLTFPDLYKGREACELVFIDRDASTPDTPRYIQLSSFGLRKLGIARLEP